VVNLRPDADHPDRCNIVVDRDRVRRVLLRIAADIDELAFLKDTADRIGSYLDDQALGTTLRLLLQRQLDELTAAIAGHESHPAPGRQPPQR
jgi:hypothetical protein